MKKEYDFSKAVRGKFYRKGAVLQFPIYLDQKSRSQLERLARKTGKEVGAMVNQFVRKELDLLEDLL